MVPYYGAWGSISRTLTICQRWSRWLTFIAVAGWCQVSSVTDDLGHQLYCGWNNWFGSRTSISGVSALHGYLVILAIYSALVSLKTCNVEQNFCSPLRFVKLELFWPSEMLWEIELHAWRGSVEVLWTRTSLYRPVVIIYFVLECKELWLFTFGWEPRVFWELLEVDHALVASWICDQRNVELFNRSFRKDRDFLTWNCISISDIGSRESWFMSRWTVYHNIPLFLLVVTLFLGFLSLSCRCVLPERIWLLCASEQKIEAGVCA